MLLLLYGKPVTSCPEERPNLQSRTAKRLCLLAVLLLGLLLVAVACNDSGGNGKTTPATTPRSTPGTTPSPEASPGTPGTAGELPQDFPKDFPLYPNAKINETARFSDQVFATAETDDSRSAVADFYRDALQRNPWKVLIQQDYPDQGMVLIRFAHVDEPISGSISAITIEGADQSTVLTIRFTVPESIGSPVPRLQSSPTPEGGGQ